MVADACALLDPLGGPRDDKDPASVKQIKQLRLAF
jgi:hypothetical protein